ncbi:MAG: hypothetical protein A2219_00890 [Elusimicrobia bacterium RIFOXYA2_FULL_50_26]|nr:MAG: hypothetical protein A2219_00890 [Elusimicrobia bacterium RIFOXYA2_FULL_50_26]OGS24225.1 MAG: hypothetical protein A2314_00950 [Elusimicrobia bacterium RIFOXYB2_FULL_50_12]
MYAGQIGFLHYANRFSSAESFLEDLDPRDEYNRPVTAASAKKNIENLFTAGLYELLVNTEIHSIASALAVLRRYLNLAAVSLGGAAGAAAQKFIVAILPSPRQWGNVLQLLFHIFSFLVVTANLKFRIANLQFPSSNAAFACLRC